MKRLAMVLMCVCLTHVPTMAETVPEMPEDPEKLWVMYLDLLERVEALERTVAKLTGSGLLTTDEEPPTVPVMTTTAEDPEWVAPTVPVITAPAEEEPAEDEPTSYSAGSYIVGKTIPAGEYVLYPTQTDRQLYVKVCTDANGRDIIYNELTSGMYIATVYDGEFFTFERARAVPFTGNEEPDLSAESYVVKVGVHIEPGLYLATANVPDRSGYYCIYSDSRYHDIVANDIFDSMSYFTVEEGQYLKIERCAIEKQ